MEHDVQFGRDGAGGDLVARVLKAGGIQKMRANATTLREKEWESVDGAVIGAAQPLLVGINDLRARPALVRPFDAMSVTALTYDVSSDMEDAELSMKLSQRARNDRAIFTRTIVPAPFTTKFFEIDARDLNVSRNGGAPLDTTSAALAGIKVAQMLEQVLFRGASTYKAAGGTLYGYCDFPSRNTGSLGTSWATETGDNIMLKVTAMMAASIADYHYGPWMLYVPQAYSAPLNKDLKAASDKSIISRIREIDGIIDVKVAPKLTAENVVLVEMSPSTIQLGVGMDITNIPWNTETGDLMHIVAACMIPLPKADGNGNCGIVHYS